MSNKRRFEDRYISGDLPWNLNRPDHNIFDAIQAYRIKPCKTLDMGCGTGDNVFHAIGLGFDASGIDISPTAIEMARKKAATKNISTDFHIVDLLKDEIPGKPYGLIFDRGCFHSFKKPGERKLVANRVSDALEKDGIWISLMGNYDDGRLDVGPPKLKAIEIVKAVETHFEILKISQSRFESNDEIPSKIWVVVLRKR